MNLSLTPDYRPWTLPLCLVTLLLGSCGGGGGSGGDDGGNPPAVSLTLTAVPATVTAGTSSTLTWTSTNATDCSAGGGWTGSLSLSGSEATENLAVTTTYNLTCTGPGGSASQSATVTVSPVTAGVFPLRVEAGKRHLVDAQGLPFFLNGDTAWALMVQLDPAEAEQYLENRRQNGMNAIVVELIENTFGDNAPANYAGEDPFTGANFATPNEAYFAYAEDLIELAAEKGILVLLSPAYMGYQGNVEGWYDDMLAAGNTVLRNYGRYLGDRFAGHDNIMWVHAGDYDPPAAGVAAGNAIAEGIVERDPTGRWLHTVHSDRNTSAVDSAFGGSSWLTADAIYTSDTNVVAEAYQSWNTSPLPYFLYEAYYEETNDGDFVRKMAYQAVLSGAYGHVMGNNRVWKAKPGWQAYLDSDGATSMRHLRDLFTSREWWLLVPDTARTFLTAGVNPGSNHAPAALASDGSFGLVYTPEVRQLTVNLGRLAGPRVTARWFDPSSGASSTVAGSPFTASGSRAFLPPGNNSEGAGDWVLVLEATP